MAKITKRMKEILDFLGNDYTIKNIDFEDCVYKDFGKYDIEVSGCNSKRKNATFSIYVWERKGEKFYQANNVQRVHQIQTLQTLKEELKRIESEIKAGTVKNEVIYKHS